MMHPGMGQRPPGPYPGPGDMRGPAPVVGGAGTPGAPGQPLPMGPPTPVNPPTGQWTCLLLQMDANLKGHFYATQLLTKYL